MTPFFGELLDNLAAPDEEARTNFTCWIYSLNTFAPSVVFELEPASFGRAMAAAEVAARMQRAGSRGGVAVALHAGVEALYHQRTSGR
ncbi:hypothetical protein GPECTOR_30g177 [Gonium pectorale]|uniref:Uncharacterized protein n=1 Tax=Gonium pectorale TaxID=33097 RepID=A0A150GE17_GONPE|nr:hypothetical protein GPECTOR_30g177 [Gonium pectorale]|eukprot:KXZ48082.1 hypothetical protein GPECTOR_30g177 [Gonium pectorale]